MKSLNVLTLWDTVHKVSCCVVLCTPAVKCNPCLFYPPLTITKKVSHGWNSLCWHILVPSKYPFPSEIIWQNQNIQLVRTEFDNNVMWSITCEDNRIMSQDDVRTATVHIHSTALTLKVMLKGYLRSVIWWGWNQNLSVCDVSLMLN